MTLVFSFRSLHPFHIAVIPFQNSLTLFSLPHLAMFLFPFFPQEICHLLWIFFSPSTINVHWFLVLIPRLSAAMRLSIPNPLPPPPPIALHLIRFTYNLSNFNSKSKNSMSWRKPLIDFEFLDRHDCISAAYLFLLLSFLSFLSHFQFIPSICGHPHEIENFFCSKYSTISMNHICASELHIIQFV